MSEFSYEEELKKIGVHKVMTKDVIAANPNNKFSQLFQFFSDRNVNHMPICDNGVLLGIISNKDMMRYLYRHVVVEKNTNLAELDEKLKLTDIMTKNPLSVDANTNLFDVREIFYKAPFSCLPVTFEGKIVGVMTPKDFVKMRIIHVDGAEYGGY